MPDLVIIGGGPAGMMAGLLFARAGLTVTVLEKHADFLRDFRGDTVHPSTLRILDDLGLLGRFLARPHDKVREIAAHFGGRRYAFADFRGRDPRWSFVAMMPQWEFLDFLAEAAGAYPGFRLHRGCPAEGLVEEAGRIVGVTHAGGRIDAGLVILADGRGSALRDKAGLRRRDLGAPIDVLWFRLPKLRTAGNQTAGYFDRGRVLILIDRGDYWQCAFVIGKGEAETVRAAGLPALRSQIAAMASLEPGQVAALDDWSGVKLLSVALDRLESWHRPGLLAIGDAAHAMSPVGGIGINLAIQDAVAAANLLAAPMAEGRDVTALLPGVARRRLPVVRLYQRLQIIAQSRIIGPALAGDAPRAPWPLRLTDAVPPLRRLPAALIGFGPRAERVRSPAAGGAGSL